MPDPTFVLALGAAILGAASLILHVVAPRTKNTWDDALRDDVDEVLAFARAQKTAAPLAAVPPRDPQAGFISGDLLCVLLPIAMTVGVVCVALACGATSKAVLADAVDCTTADRVKLEAQVGPTFELALQRALGSDGKINLPSLNQISKPLEADGWCVLEKEVARLIASTLTANPSAPAAAAAPLDARDLAAKVSALRAAKFGAMRFQLASSPQ